MKSHTRTIVIIGALLIIIGSAIMLFIFLDKLPKLNGEKPLTSFFTEKRAV